MRERRLIIFDDPGRKNSPMDIGTEELSPSPFTPIGAPE
jgi:hypothetical protein